MWGRFVRHWVWGGRICRGIERGDLGVGGEGYSFYNGQPGEKNVISSQNIFTRCLNCCTIISLFLGQYYCLLSRFTLHSLIN